MPVVTLKPKRPSPFPSLRTALWLYFFVLLSTGIAMIQWSPYIDPALLRFVVTLFVVLGFTLGVLYYTRTQLSVVVGRGPDLISIVASVIAGAAIWMPVFWLSFIGYRWLDTTYGHLPDVPPSSLTVVSLLLQSGIVIPLCQGLLFFGVIQFAATKFDKVQRALLVAVLFAFYSLLISPSGLGLASIPGQFIVYLVAALAVTFTGRVWYGVVISAVYALIWTIFNNQILGLQLSILNYIGPEDFGKNFLTVRWLFPIVIGAFLTFLMLQVISARATAQKTADTLAQSVTPARLKAWWWLPLLLSLVFVLFAGYGEIGGIRKLHPIAQAAPPAATKTSGSTSLPIPLPTVALPGSGQ